MSATRSRETSTSPTEPGGVRRATLAAFVGLATACGPVAGEDGSQILLAYDQLSGGVVFATRAIVGARGYDLFWAPVPLVPTVTPQPVFQLTESGGSEWQPSVSTGGNGIAYARRGEGIFFIGTDGKINRISDPGDRYADSLPAVSHDGSFVAWVREDRSRPIGNGFFETFIMLSLNDGSDAQPIDRKDGLVQDAPRFEPVAGSRRIVWSEFDPNTWVDSTGPTRYRLWVHNFRDNIGQPACEDPPVIIGDTVHRCFGQHLAWPRSDVLVVTQSFFEVFLDSRSFAEVYSNVLGSVEGQQIGGPVFSPTSAGYTSFPISASYLGDQRLIFDGVVTNVDGSLTTLALWVATPDGSQAWRLQLDGYGPDIDLGSTNNYLFSVATPQLIP